MTTIDLELLSNEENNNYWCASNPNIQRAWSASSLSVLQQCPFKYYLTYIIGYRGDSTPAQAFGKFYHSSLEKYDAALLEGADTIEASAVALREAHSLVQDWKTDDTARNHFTLFRAIAWYGDRWENDPFITQTIDGKPAVELSFKIALPLANPDGDQYILTGFLDGVAAYEEDYLWTRERKSTKQTISPNHYKNYQLNNQSYLYTLAGEIIIGEDFEGVLYDVAQTAVNFTEFGRHLETKTSDQLEEWIENTLYWLELAEGYAERGKWPMNLESCNQYGGCVFRSHCNKSPSMREKFIPGGMEIKKREYIDQRED